MARKRETRGRPRLRREPRAAEVSATPAPPAGPPAGGGQGKPSDQAPERPPFPIVGIGASAGGVEAVSRLLRAIPTDTGMAFVLVHHLDPTQPSQLPDILRRTTRMPVVSIRTGLAVEPNHVYVIPPNAEVTIAGGVFEVTPREAGERHRSIDHLFRSLAQDQESHAIGVVLSGTGSDGMLGLKAIKAEGGITFVQDEESALHRGMPHSALAFADFVLPPEGIARELVRLSQHPYVNHRAALTGPTEDSADIGTVLRILRGSTGVDFTQYKPGTVRRRIARRMLLAKVDDLAAYIRYLRQTPSEVQALHDDILIQVTGFFRDPESYDALEQVVFPSLVKERGPGDPIRVWVPGCATGEEAYSLAIRLQEYLDARKIGVPIQMFATDLSAAAVARARSATYPASIEHEVSPDRLRRYFVKIDGRYQVSKSLREAIVFAQHDLTRDPPFSRLDLISCCNVLIYLSAALQERVVPLFHYALKPDGFLKLGRSESVGRFTNLFSLVDKKHKIYARRTTPAAHAGFGLTAADRPGTMPPAVAVPAEEANAWSRSAVEREADRLVLGRYAPAGMVVNSDLEIVQFRGKTGPYLEAAPGTASLSLLRMAREGLAGPLRQALQQAAGSVGPVKMVGVRVKSNGGVREVDLEVIPIGPGPRAPGRHYLVLFFDARHRAGEPGGARARDRAPRPVAARGGRAAQLERELAAAQREIETMREEYEAAIEELRAATEEAQSSNEELQSTNEELETAKEELQATNEELTTVNDELNSRNAELAELSSDLGNLLASVHIPILMVGADLRLRRMTPATERVLGVAPADVGRPVADLRLSAEIPEMERLVRDVIESLAVQEREVRARDGRWYALRVRPYRTVDNKIEGAVVSFVDIDALKRGLDQAKQARDQAYAIIATVRSPLVILDTDLRVVMANRAFYETYRLTPEEGERPLLFELGNRQWDIPRLRALLEDVLARDRVVEDVEIELDLPGAGRRTVCVNARRAPVPGQPPLILLALEDVTAARRAEAARQALLQEQTARAEAEAATRAKDRFLAVLSHELRTPLTAVLGWARVLRTQTLDPAATAQALEIIERNTRLQVRLIEDLLDISRIAEGRFELEVRPVMPAPAVHAAVEAMRWQAEAKGVRLESALDADAGPVLGDPLRLQQIVWNLVSNAIKFTPSGGRVEIQLARRDREVVLSVRDTGRGFTPERLRELFTSAPTTPGSTEPRVGLGLGLTIVRHLVELQRGTIRAESAGPEQGATFTVTFPVSEVAVAEEVPVRRALVRAAGPERLPRLDGVRVLVVDDEADTRELVREVLTRCGAEVVTATDAREGLQALERERFDVLVSDVVMPGQDGHDLIRAVRALPPERGGRIPALALTAYASIEDRDAALAAGFQQHAAKPVEPGDLAAAVAVLAGRRPEA
jgi:two-component system CheB/CheR fusion protein